MRTPVLAFLSISVLTLVGVFAYESYVSRQLSERISTQISAIEEAYATIIQTHVAAVSDRIPEDARLTHDLFSNAATLANLSGQGDILHRLNTINRAQRVLRKAVEAAAADPVLAVDPDVIALARAMGEKGEVRTLLGEFNTSARLWNTHARGMLGSLTASVTGTKKQQLPYLRFDGELEMEQQIQFGG